LIISAVSLPLACRYLERIWGFKETIRFCFLTIIGGNIIAFGFTWLLYLVLGIEDAW
jgi:low affinity Fe/Cu permease